MFLELNTSKLPEKIFLENCQMISEAINNFLSSLFNNCYIFWSDAHQSGTSSSAKDLLKNPLIDPKYYGKYLAKVNAITSWSGIENQTRDKSFNTFIRNQLKPFLTKLITNK